MTPLLEIFIAYVLADLLGGLYHLATDHGCNIRSQVALFQWHHENPAAIGWDFKPAIGGIPILLLGVFWWHPIFFAALGIAVCFGQMPHYWAHHKVRHPVRFLQRARIILPPRHHARHHSGHFDQNYCVLSGWNNFWLNWIART
jgi:Lipid desaturase domain